MKQAVIAAVMVMIGAQAAVASEGAHTMEGMAHHHADGMQAHMHARHEGEGHQMKGMFMVKKDIDGYTVTFHAMKPKAGMDMGMHGKGSHHFMVKVEKDGKPLTDIVVNSKVEHPNHKSESKMMMKMGDWYMAAYDLGHPGDHKLMVLFKTKDGKKHFGGVHYPVAKGL